MSSYGQFCDVIPHIFPKPSSPQIKTPPGISVILLVHWEKKEFTGFSLICIQTLVGDQRHLLGQEER